MGAPPQKFKTISKLGRHLAPSTAEGRFLSNHSKRGETPSQVGDKAALRGQRPCRWPPMKPARPPPSTPCQPHQHPDTEQLPHTTTECASPFADHPCASPRHSVRTHVHHRAIVCARLRDQPRAHPRLSCCPEHRAPVHRATRGLLPHLRKGPPPPCRASGSGCVGEVKGRASQIFEH